MKANTATEQKIIAAAAKLFLNKGMGGARMQEIADLAGINKALLHYYFRSKEQLYRLVARQEIKKAFAEIFGTLPEVLTGKDWLRNFVHNYLQTVANNPQLTRFLVWEIGQGGNEIGAIVRECLQNAMATNKSAPNELFQTFSNSSGSEKQTVHFFINIIAMCVYPYIAKPILENLFPGLEIGSQEFLQSREESILSLVLSHEEQK